MKYAPRTIGFLQAAGLALYVSLFAITIQWVKAQDIQPQEVFAIILFLLAFIISAVIGTSLILVYPISLFFSNKRTEAIKIVVWSLVWLIVFFAIFLAVGI